MTNWAQAERAGLVDDFLAVGPDAPTLCAGWTTRDLAAHLIVRERRPDAALGILVPFLAHHTEHVQRQVGARPWAEVVEDVRTGPPWWSPLRPVDAVANLVEYYVHHEDVRRAQPDWEPRPLDPDFEAMLWRTLHRMARVLVRRAPTGVVLRRPSGDEITAKSARGGGPSVTVTGTPGELVLFGYGRQAHARVEIVADDATAERVRTAKLGL
jgi:uncharacterized protein (TIGR03085 family)